MISINDQNIINILNTGQLLVGLDLGDRTIGVAISDKNMIIGSPLVTINRKGGIKDIDSLEKIIKDYNVGGIVLGLPISLDGKENLRTKKTRDFADFLTKKILIKIFYQDERFSTDVIYKELKKAEPDLSHIKYALFCLGDSSYKDTFAFGGKKLDKLFLSLKAKPIGTSYFHDASESTLPEDEGLKWFKENKINKLFI